MSAELLSWAIEATAMITVAILLVLALRPILARAFGIRAAIVVWLLVPLLLIVGLLPARSIDVVPASDTQTVISLDGLGTVGTAARQNAGGMPDGHTPPRYWRWTMTCRCPHSGSAPIRSRREYVCSQA